jgi:hypothetical protein
MQHRVIKFVDREIERMWKNTAVACCKAISRHLPRETEVVNENISIMIVYVEAEITVKICNYFRLKCAMSCVFSLNVKRS